MNLFSYLVDRKLFKHFLIFAQFYHKKITLKIKQRLTILITFSKAFISVKLLIKMKCKNKQRLIIFNFGECAGYRIFLFLSYFSFEYFRKSLIIKKLLKHFYYCRQKD